VFEARSAEFAEIYRRQTERAARKFSQGALLWLLSWASKKVTGVWGRAPYNRTRTGSIDPNYLKSKAKTVIDPSGREHKKPVSSPRWFKPPAGCGLEQTCLAMLTLKVVIF